jgi:microsomal prostaglandin-E synthase 2
MQVKLLPPNIYRTPREALQAFDYIANASNFSWAEKQSAKYVGAVAMYFVAKRALGKYGIKDPRRELYEALDKWSAEGVGLPAAGKAAAAGGVAGRSFHGGQTPDRADLAVFGVVRSIEGNYKTWEDVQANVQPGFWVWYHAVKAAMPKPVLVPLAGQQPAQAVR